MLRMARVLRPLRAINRLPGLRILIKLILETLPMLGSVVLLCLFLFVVFSILAVQVPFQRRLTPFNASLTPFNASLTPIGAISTRSNAILKLIGAISTPFNAISTRMMDTAPLQLLCISTVNPDPNAAANDGNNGSPLHQSTGRHRVQPRGGWHRVK